MTAILTETALDLPLYARGKVRDIYDLGDTLLIVATDRISAFDVVLPTGIPDKGLVLTQLSAFWFELTGDFVPNHFIRLVDGTRIEGVAAELPRQLIGRAMLVRKARRIDSVEQFRNEVCPCSALSITAAGRKWFTYMVGVLYSNI